MAMTPAATVAASIVSSLGITGPSESISIAQWTTIIAQIQAMIEAGTVTVIGTATGVTAGSAAVPVTGTGTLA